jgi:hypothetical protein
MGSDAGSEIHRRRGLADAALLIGDAENLRHHAAFA